MNDILDKTPELLTIAAAVAGVARFRNILSRDRPCIYLLLLASVNIIVGEILAHTIRNNFPSNNIYLLIDVIFNSILFYNWGCLYPRRKILWLLHLAFAGIWVFEIHSVPGLFRQDAAFGLIYSCVLGLMGIDRINAFILNERGNLLRNGRFLYCLGELFFCVYYVIIGAFLWINPPVSEQFYTHLENLWEGANVLLSLTIFIAIFRLPVREKFSITEVAPKEPTAKPWRKKKPVSPANFL